VETAALRIAILPMSRIQGVLLLSSPLIAGNPQLIADLAIRRNLPTISLFPEIARAGGHPIDTGWNL
jgi:hypothetical protein